MSSESNEQNDKEKKSLREICKKIFNIQNGLIVLVFFGFPILLNIGIVSFNVPWRYVGKGEEWLGFFSNYAGGFIGAIVALIVANKQGEEQRKSVQEQLKATEKENLTQFERAQKAEKRQRTLAQLPALVFLENQIKRMWGNMHAEKLRKEVHMEHSYNTFQRDLTPKEEEEVKKEVENRVYYIDLVNEQSFSYISLVIDIDLHTRLIECFTFYKEFSETLRLDIAPLEKEIKELAKSTNKYGSTGVQNIASKLAVFTSSKSFVWEQLDKKNQLENFEEVYRMLGVELSRVRKLLEED